jgi:hypothetical protein
VQARFQHRDVSIEGRSSEYRRIADSGNAPRFHFCLECGSTVYYLLEQSPEVIAVPVGAFADASFPSPRRSVYGSRRHSWVVVPSDVEHHD